MKHLLTLEQFVNEAGGQEAGKLEIANITIEDAYSFLDNYPDFNVESQIPHFEKNFKIAQKLARMGKTKRKDMPVIDTTQVKAFQRDLEDGFIDINEPYASSTDKTNPFPEGLAGSKAKDFIERGLRDGLKRDDKIDVRITKLNAKQLIPIQRQIYFDKSMKSIIEFGVDGSMDFIGNQSFFIVSSDNYIIDGHHRMLSAILMSPGMTINALQIDMPIEELLPLSKAYGDAIGNKRNA